MGKDVGVCGHIFFSKVVSMHKRGMTIKRGEKM